MKKPITLLLLLFSTATQAQLLSTQSLEVTLWGRYDKYTDYVTRYGNVSYTNELKLSGKSYGASVNYRWEALKGWYLLGGIGYYRLGVDRIQNRRHPALTGEETASRPVDYQGSALTAIMRHTPKYHYNNIALSAGLYKAVALNRNWSLVTGTDVMYLYTYSQKYHLNATPSSYRTKNTKSFGFQWSGALGVNRAYRRYYLSPRLVLPLYLQWKRDAVFREDPQQKLDKWLDGLGASLTIGKYL